jgi:hypothetical protein
MINYTSIWVARHNFKRFREFVNLWKIKHKPFDRRTPGYYIDAQLSEQQLMLLTLTGIIN